MDANRRLTKIVSRRAEGRNRREQEQGQTLKRLTQQAQGFAIRYLTAQELIQLGSCIG